MSDKAALISETEPITFAVPSSTYIASTEFDANDKPAKKDLDDKKDGNKARWPTKKRTKAEPKMKVVDESESEVKDEGKDDED
jgi:hypothetical protein